MRRRLGFVTLAPVHSFRFDRTHLDACPTVGAPYSIYGWPFAQPVLDEGSHRASIAMVRRSLNDIEIITRERIYPLANKFYVVAVVGSQSCFFAQL